MAKAEQLTIDTAAKAVIQDFESNGKRSLPVAQRRITKHLTPFFTGRRLAGVTAVDVQSYIVHRKVQGIVATTFG